MHELSFRLPRGVAAELQPIGNNLTPPQIETAYDVLLMDNMKKRLSGTADVAKSVRFADVPRPKKKVQVRLPEDATRSSVDQQRHLAVFRSEVSVLSCSSGQSCLHQWSTLCSAIGAATN